MTARLLIVDDEPDFLDIMTEFLLDEGYEVLAAANGEEALAILQKNSFDLLISDINMPGMKGFELLARAAELYPAMKRVLITAYDVRDYLNMAKNFNIGNIMTKTTPFNFEEIKLFINNILTAAIFGLGKYIKGTVHQAAIRTSDDIEIVNNMIIGFMNSDRHKRKFRQVLGEILINAFFYGAKNEDPEKKHGWNFNTTLNQGEEVLVSWARDNEKSGVSVLDQKGRLKKNDVIYWIERNTTKGDDGISLGLGDCHGKGLFITREIIDRMIINIEPGKKTEVVTINYEEGLYDGHRPLWIQEV